MVFKIHTSKKTMQIFTEISASENLAPFILSKLSISMSIKSDEPLLPDDMKKDNLGLELNRQTITGEYDALYKCLIEMFEKKHINDDDYFQIYIKAHLDRGAKLLHSEYKYGRDFLIQLLKSDIGI